jgi:hypothetical protein
MLRPEQLKPYINHPERAVKNFAVKYFRESFNQDPDLLPLVLQSVIADPADSDNEMRLMQAKQFTQTNATVAELLKRLKDKADDFAFEYNQLLVYCDLDLWTAFPDGRELLNPLARGQIELRMKLAKFSTEHLWSELQRYTAQGLDDDCYFDNDEYDDEYDTWLIKELIKRTDVPLAEITACLNRQFSDAGDDSLEYSLCELVGELKLAAGLPFLLRSLAKEDELLNEAATEALTKLGTVEVVQALESLYPQGTPDVRIYAAGALMNIKLPEAEAALLRLWRLENDTMISPILATGLCNLLSTQAIPLIRELIYQGYERGMVCLEEELYINCLINGKDLPEMPKWREIIAENLAEIDSWDIGPGADDWECGDCDCDDCDDCENCDYNDDDDDYEQLADAGATDWDGKTDADFQPQVEQRRIVKIGRNDPCPCGSGKKYKKCCLSKPSEKGHPLSVKNS